MTEYSLHTLRERLDAHLGEIDEQARTRFTVETTERLHKALSGALDRWDDLSEEQQSTLADAILYVVDVDDAEHDAESPVGLDDDVDIVRTALASVAPDLEV